MSNVEKFMLLLLCIAILEGCKEPNLYKPPEKQVKEKRDAKYMRSDFDAMYDNRL